MMKLSSEVFSPGMAYVALSHVKEIKNLYLIAFDAKSVMVSSKCLQEVKRLRQTYRLLNFAPHVFLVDVFYPDW